MLRNETSDARRRSRAGRWARLGAAALVGATMTIAMGGIAAADPTPAEHPTATGATVTTADGVNVRMTGGPISATQGAIVSTAIISIEYAGKTELAYCIDLAHPLLVGRPKYESTEWEESGVQNLPKIKWILLNSYPTVNAATIAAKAGAQGPANIEDKKLERLVYAGTQTAVWHFSDGVDLASRVDGENMKDTTAEEYGVIESVYNYLTDDANNKPSDTADPAPKLTITPATSSGAVGDKVGPFTVTSGGGTTTLTATGGKIVDKNGNAVTTLASGGQFWLTSETAGTVTVKATGSGEIPIGRVFVCQSCQDEKNGRPFGNQTMGAERQFQKIILAGVVGAKLEAGAKATFEAGGSLPVTGASITAAVATGLVLLAGGGLVLMTIRRRRVRFTA